MTFDLVVFGGGIAGIHCALAAGRLGKEVLLVEQTGTLGGMATSGLVNPFMRYWLNEKHLVKGLFSEVLNQVESLGGLYQNTFDSEIMKIVLHNLIEKEKNIKCLFNTMPIEVQKSQNQIKSAKIVTNLSENFEIKSRFWVDATGNASFAYLSGSETVSGDLDGENQALTTMFVISEVDFSKIRNEVKNKPKNFFAWVKPEMELISCAGYFQEIEKARKEGVDYPNSYFFFVQLPGHGRVSVNTTHISIDTTDSFQISQAINTGVSQCLRVFSFAKKYIAGFEKAVLEKIAPQIGIRENRRVKGLYEFKELDVKKRQKYKDGVVKGCYGIDIHKNATELNEDELSFVPIYNDYYEIPLRALISKDYHNLFMAGRCISSDFPGQSAARIMPTCAGMGQALGVYLGFFNGTYDQYDKKELFAKLEEIAIY